jgi:hypothetical protein
MDRAQAAQRPIVNWLRGGDALRTATYLWPVSAVPAAVLEPLFGYEVWTHRPLPPRGYQNAFTNPPIMVGVLGGNGCSGGGATGTGGPPQPRLGTKNGSVKHPLLRAKTWHPYDEAIQSMRRDRVVKIYVRSQAEAEELVRRAFPELPRIRDPYADMPLTGAWQLHPRGEKGHLFPHIKYMIGKGAHQRRGHIYFPHDLRH